MAHHLVLPPLARPVLRFGDVGGVLGCACCLFLRGQAETRHTRQLGAPGRKAGRFLGGVYWLLRAVLLLGRVGGDWWDALLIHDFLKILKKKTIKQRLAARTSEGKETTGPCRYHFFSFSSGAVACCSSQIGLLRVLPNRPCRGHVLSVLCPPLPLRNLDA